MTVLVAVAIGLGVGKTFYLRDHPPTYALKDANSYQGFVSADGFSRRSALIRDALIDKDGAREALRLFLEEDLHPNSLSVPALVGVLGSLGGSIPVIFMALSALAVAFQVGLVIHIGRQVAGEVSTDAVDSLWAALMCGVLFASSLLLLRTSAQLILDPFCSVLMLLCLAAAMERSRRPTASGALLVFAIQTAGVFTKVSYLPGLAIPAVVAFAVTRSARAAVMDGLLLGLLPLLPLLVYLAWVPGVGSATRDFEHFWASWKLSPEELRHFGVEMVLLLQFWPLLIVLSWIRGGRLAKAAIGSALMILVATWSFRLPAVPRLYLPALAITASAVSPVFLGWSVRAKRRGFYALAVVCTVNVAAMVSGTFF